ncbi:glyoxalase [Salinigranum rubrum]|uniref:Glyoxalase n=1 Tax=Salinigranum rubrum TaxID=755307 RepID=A0A2I8VPN7_9EURY|nr:VOC family protein [Salinigranum rubrum]AUV83878.1 glyoxalase [Salinigranum rubrum]
MIGPLSQVTLVVGNQTDAATFYTDKLGFEKRADEPMGEDKRWVTVAPPEGDLEIVLQSPDWFEDEEVVRRRSMIGESPELAFSVDDCRETYETLTDRGVEFHSPPESVPWGVQAVAYDLYGNRLVLIEQNGDSAAE